MCMNIAIRHQAHQAVLELPIPLVAVPPLPIQKPPGGLVRPDNGLRRHQTHFDIWRVSPCKQQ